MADVEQVIIEFLVDDSELDAAGKKLSQFGKVDNQNNNILSKTNVELAKRNALLAQGQLEFKQSQKATKDFTGSLAALDAQTKEVIENFIDGFLEQMQVELKDAKKEIDRLKDSMGKTKTETTSFRAKAKELTNQMTALKLEGKDNTAEYAKLRKELGNLRDTMSDVAAEANSIGSDTRVFDGLISAAQGVAGGFAVAQGTMALFGEEGEEIQQTLLKVNAAMAILQGLQQVQQTLQKESAASLLLLNNAQKTNVVVTTLATGAESKNIVVKTASAAASRALAMATALANPIMLALVAVIGAVIVAYRLFTRSAREAEEAQNEMNLRLEESMKIGEEFDEFHKRGAEKRLQILKEEGKTEKQLREARIKENQKLLVDQNQRLLDNEADFEAAKQQLRISTDDEERERLQKYVDNYEKMKDAALENEHEIFMLQSENRITTTKEEEDALKKRKEDRDKARAAEIEAERKRLAQQLAGLQLEQLGLDKSSQKWFQLEKQIISVTGQIDKLNKTGKERELSEAQTNFAIGDLIASRVATIEKSEDLISDKVQSSATKKIDIAKELARIQQSFIVDTQASEAASLELREQRYEEFAANVKSKVDFIAQIYNQLSTAIQGLQNEQMKNAQLEIEGRRAVVEEDLRLGKITEKEAQQRNERIDAAEKRLKQQQAVRDKQLAIFNAIIATAQAVSQALTAGPILGPILAGVIGLLGLAQIQAIRNRPIPKFGTGKHGSYEGIAEVGETGAELIKREDGSMQIAKRKSYTHLSSGDEVYSPAETRRMLLDRPSMQYMDTRARASAHDSDSIIDYEQLSDIITGKAAQMHMNVDKDGLRIWMVRGNNKTEYLNKKRKF